jgi:uncharacterized protein YoxC
MDPLHIALIVLVVVAVWAVVELALTFKKTRASLEEVTRSANETIEQLQPVISKMDGVVDDLQPSVKQVPELVGKAQTAIDAATIDLAKVGDILDDVSDVSGVAASASTAASNVATAAVDGVSGLVSKITGHHPVAGRKPALAGKQKARLEDGAHGTKGSHAAEVQEGETAHSQPSSTASQRAYVTYGSADSEAKDATASGKQPVSVANDSKKSSE